MIKEIEDIKLREGAVVTPLGTFPEAVAEKEKELRDYDVLILVNCICLILLFVAIFICRSFIK